jgi:hypothetical protein
MAKGSGRLASDFDIDETGGVLSGLLAEEEELDRSALWRLGTWAALSIGAVIVALITNQSSIGMRREQTASAELLKQTQQVQIAARETQSEARRLASAIETLNGDRDRLYSRVAVLEQGLDSVTGAIARQNSTPPSSSAQASATPVSTSPVVTTSPAATNPASASPAAAAGASATPSSPSAPTTSASTVPASTASVDPQPVTPKPTPAPAVAPVAATAAAVADKPAPAPAVSEPSPTVASLSAQKPVEAAQASGSLMASKSIMAPPDPAAGKLIESATPPRTVTSAPMPEVAAVTPPAHDEAEPDTASAAHELVVKRTEFGVDVGGANSIPGLRALWRGLLQSRANAALTTLRPIIVIKENSNGLGMQLRLVAGPISDAAAAAKICASLTANDRNCTTAVFEGQRLALNADEQPKADAKMIADAKPVSDPNPKPAASKGSSHKHYAARHAPKEEAPKSESPSAMSLIFGRR